MSAPSRDDIVSIAVLMNSLDSTKQKPLPISAGVISTTRVGSFGRTPSL